MNLVLDAGALEAVTVSLEDLDARVAPGTLVAPVVGHLQSATRLLEGLQSDKLRKRLASLADETAALAGWLASDAGDHGVAQSYYTTALDAAREADDRSLGAYVLGSASVLPAFRRSPRQVISLLRDGTQGISSRHASPATSAWMSTLEAEAHTAAGNASGALAALDRASTALDRATAGDPRPRVSFFDHARLTGERGVIAVRLGRPLEAQATLDEALANPRPLRGQDPLPTPHQLGHGSAPARRYRGGVPADHGVLGHRGANRD